MSVKLVGNTKPIVTPILGKRCHWCNKPAFGHAQKGLGQFHYSCGEHGALFRRHQS